MHPVIHILSLIGIISLSLGSLTGCGEKRVHVATLSGAPGQEASLESEGEISDTETSGLGDTTLDESALSSQIPDAEAGSTEPEIPSMINEPINLVHEPTPSSQDGSSDSSMGDSIDPSLSHTISPTQESSSSDNTGSLTPMEEGQDFAAQSSSAARDLSTNSSGTIENSTPTISAPPQEERLPELSDPSANIQDTFPGEDLEPIPDSFQIAKAEPSEGLQDRMNQLKNEELAAAAAGLEDVFFQFDSWTLTDEGKQALKRSRGWFKQEPSSNLIIEGHADQRGTQAYNMVLGKKRAVAVQDYLAQLGVSTSRMTIISYGKDKPFCLDATEVCHQLNRRGHLLIAN